MHVDELRFEYQEDYAITAADRELLRQLLASCFEGHFQDRVYYKQTPKARFLVRDEDALVAQLAMEDRVIRVGEDALRIFGVIDLCVATECRHRGVASRLLREIETLACKHDVDFLVLFADEPALYRRHGFEYVPNTARWLAIDEHQSLSILEKSLGDCFMVKALKDRLWDRAALVDLLGYLF